MVKSIVKKAGQAGRFGGIRHSDAFSLFHSSVGSSTEARAAGAAGTKGSLPARDRHLFTGRVRSTTGPGKTEPLLRRGENPSARPTWRQSEIDDMLRLKTDGQIVESQVSFLNGERCGYGASGSIRVDNLVDGRIAYEMKNYDLTGNVNGLVRDVVEQAVRHQQHLPAGTRQVFKIDTRGQVAPLELQRTMKQRIVSQSQGILSLDDIKFIE